MVSLWTSSIDIRTRTYKTAVTYIEVALYKAPYLNVDLSKLFSILLSRQDPLPIQLIAYQQLYFSQQRVRFIAYFKHVFSVLDIKPLMIATNLILG